MTHKPDSSPPHATGGDLLRDPALASFGPARAGTAADAVDGVVPAVVVEPDSHERLAGVLAWASHGGHPTVLRGGGSKLGWGRVPARVDLLVAMSRLSHAVEHRYGDLTVTADGGVRVRDLNWQLARHGQRLPVDVTSDRATVGGMLAANDAGPLRHRYGTPRDLLIGVTLATTDGRLIKAGGHVVKNVAGYDLGKLMAGSHGTLAAVANATFRLLPIRPASATLIVHHEHPAAAAGDVEALLASQLEPEVLEVQAAFGAAAPPVERYRLLVRFATSPAAVQAQAAAAAALVTGRVETAADDSAGFARGVVESGWPDAAQVRVSWSPASLAAVLELHDAVQRETGAALRLAGRAGVGTGILDVGGDLPAQRAVVERLRAATVVGHVAILHAARGLKERVDVWGAPPATARVLRSVKAAFDPAGILNAGRGPL